jgi:YihY family inner membrane protein
VSLPAPAPKTDRRARLTARALELPPVRWLRPIVDDYLAAGGSLLAAGLAFNALLAALPAILLLISLVGLFLNDPAQLDLLIEALAERFPPLEEFFRVALAQFDAGALSFSVVGLIGLVWGSSRFYQSLDDAIARIFQGSPRRDPLQRALRGVLSVVLLLGAVLAAVYLSQLVEQVGSDLPALGPALGMATSTLRSALGSIVVFSVAMALIYRIVPTRTPTWRAIGLPSLAVGIAIAILTGVFTLLTPRLIGSLRLYGVFVAVFAAMIWLAYVAQAILVGAAWVHRRTPAASARSG